jgi:hypothetical protein
MSLPNSLVTFLCCTWQYPWREVQNRTIKHLDEYETSLWYPIMFGRTSCFITKGKWKFLNLINLGCPLEASCNPQKIPGIKITDMERDWLILKEIMAEHTLIDAEVINYSSNGTVHISGIRQHTVIKILTCLIVRGQKLKLLWWVPLHVI